MSGSILPPWTREKKHSNEAGMKPDEAGIKPSSSRPARDRSILYAMAPGQQTELNCWQNSTRIIVKRCWWKKVDEKESFTQHFSPCFAKVERKSEHQFRLILAPNIFSNFILWQSSNKELASLLTLFVALLWGDHTRAIFDEENVIYSIFSPRCSVSLFTFHFISSL